jgi:hypothetical protein
VISPVPVTLNLFFALELVLTFGIICEYLNKTLLAFRTSGLFWGHLGNSDFGINYRPKPSIKMERKGKL